MSVMFRCRPVRRLLPRRLPVRIGAGAALLTLAAAACGSTPQASGSGPAGSGSAGGLTAQSDTVTYAPGSPCPKPTATTSVTIPEIAASAALTWLFIDVDQGIFAKCGLKVDSSLMSPQAQVSAYLGGDTSLRITGGGLPADIAASNRSLGIYGVLTTDPDYYFLENKSISSPKQLIGKTIAVLSPVDSTYKTALIYLQNVGLKPSQVHFTYASTNQNIQASLQSGAAQAGVLTSPYAQVAMADGAKTAYDFTKTSLKIPAEPIVADPAWVKSNTAEALNIYRAILAGVYLAKAKPAVAQAALEKHLELNPSTAAEKVMLGASVTLAGTLYSPINQIMQPTAATAGLFKSQAPANIKAELGSTDMSSYLQTDLGSLLMKQGLPQQLAKIYGSAG